MKRAQTIISTATLALLVAGAGALNAANAQEGNASFRAVKRDPFSRYRVYFKRKTEKKESPKPMPVAPPPIQSRIDQYKAQKLAAMNLQQSAPKPTTALLLKEVEVTGIFRTPRGYAAMVEATPIKLSYVIYPGEPFYDGMLVAIEENRLVFRRETRWTDGRRDVAVETKPLRTPSVVETMTAAKETAKPADEKPDSAEAKKEEKKEEKQPAPGND
ncbi:MAG TPA: hypothetical protein VFX96_03180 [Pyrinomonadaceae bacterium]|nr:hypothetical protein [Pyrinomonadaceae bacterium]